MSDDQLGAAYNGRSAQQHAADAAEAVRGLNHTTLHAGGLPYPSAVYEVLGGLAVMAERLPQALSQLDRVYSGWVDAGHVHVESGEFVGDPPASAAAVGTYLVGAAATPSRRSARQPGRRRPARRGPRWAD